MRVIDFVIMFMILVWTIVAGLYCGVLVLLLPALLQAGIALIVSGIIIFGILWLRLCESHPNGAE